jgi:cell division protein FtsB
MGFGIGPQIVAVLLVVGLAGAMAIQPTRQLLEQRSRIAEMSRDLRRMRQQNAELATAAERLRDPDYLEQQAREQLGLVRPGETTFIVMPPSRKRKSERPRTERPPSPPGSERGYLERLFEFIGLK